MPLPARESGNAPGGWVRLVGFVGPGAFLRVAASEEQAEVGFPVFYQTTASTTVAADNPFRFVGLKIQPGQIEGRIVNRASGSAVSGATVKLLDPDGIMMELAKTDNKGFFAISLGTLDNDELKSIKKFSLEVTDSQGRSARHSLAKAATS